MDPLSDMIKWDFRSLDFGCMNLHYFCITKAGILMPLQNQKEIVRVLYLTLPFPFILSYFGFSYKQNPMGLCLDVDLFPYFSLWI